ncbi:MAG: leucine-rich repeat protein, partial [Clostridia bacterium]|nr:leucine-rich repeat protein [Clostridia bacterium]
DLITFVTERNSVALSYAKSNNYLFILEDNPESDFKVTKTSATTCTITGYTGSDMDVVIPETIGGRTVTAIGNSAFNGNSQITSVTSLYGVTSIGSYAFKNCTALTHIQITDLVTRFPDNAINGCVNLKSILTVTSA